MKKLVSRVLALAMIVTLFQASAYAADNNADTCARINQQISNTGVTFLHISDNKLIYTFEKNGETYKYVEDITSKTINTKVYLLVDHTYKHIDTIVTEIEDLKATAFHIGGSAGYIASPAAYEYDWQFVSKRDGDTAIENETIGGIAQVLALAFSSMGISIGATLLLGIAAIVLDKGLKTVYYTIYTYKDLNNPSTIRPTYKYVTYFYSDKNRTKELEGSPVTKIVDGG